MSDLLIKGGMLIAFFAVMIGVGFYCHKKSTDVNGFVLGGRSVGPWLTAFAYGTSYFSAVVFVGYAGQFGWKYGIAATWAGIANALLGSFLAWAVLGRRTRVMTQHLDSATMPQFFESRFNSKSLKLASSAVIFIFLIPYTASLYNGLSRLFGMAFNIDYSVCVIVMAIFTGIYVIAGGYMATAINDFIQGIIMLFGIVAVVIAVLKSKGGFMASLEGLAAVSDPTVSDAPGVFASFFGPDPVNLFAVMILTSLGTWGLPQMVQKFYAIKDDAAITRGSIISTIFAFVVAGGSYFIGGFGRIYTDAETIMNSSTGKLEYDAIVPMMMNEALPEILLGVLIVLVLSASMSTLSSLVLTSSSTMTIDMIKPFKKDMDDEKQVLIMRVLIVVFLALSVILAMNKNAYITTLMSVSWGALAGSFLAPFLWGLFSKKISKAAVAVCFVWGVGVTVVHTVLFSMGWFPELAEAARGLCALNITSPLNCGAFTMLSSLIICPLVSMFTMKKDGSELKAAENAFEGYRN